MSDNELVQSDDYGVEGVIYRVTVESPYHRTFEFNSWTDPDPYSSALAMYSGHTSGSARITEQFVKRTEYQTIMSRGYGVDGPVSDVSETGEQ